MVTNLLQYVLLGGLVASKPVLSVGEAGSIPAGGHHWGDDPASWC